MGVVTVDGAGSVWACGGLTVGNDGPGTLNITNGGHVVSPSTSYLSFSGVESLVTVSGIGSRWDVSDYLFVGLGGHGTINIADGGLVTNSGKTYVQYGSINFGSGGGTLTTQVLYAGRDQLAGSGTINTNDLCSDVDLVFDATHGLIQTLVLSNQGNQSIVVNLDMRNPTDYLMAGYAARGSFVIRDGVSVPSQGGILGYQSGSQGVGTVDGAGSAWIDSGDLRVGNGGRGTLSILSGGFVSARCFNQHLVTVGGRRGNWQ